MSKYTPEPWSLELDGGLCIKAKNMTICQDNMDDAKKYPEINDANFKLISLAPTLLKALKNEHTSEFIGFDGCINGEYCYVCGLIKRAGN